MRRGPLTTILTGLIAVLFMAGVASAIVVGTPPAGAPGATGSSSPARAPLPGLDDGSDPRRQAPSPGDGSHPSSSRDVSAYQGLGAWVDVFDYALAYHRQWEGSQLTPDDVDAMAEWGVRTLFLQAARLDDRTPGGIVGMVDPELVGRFLERAHARGIRVVGWYLPKFGDVERDLANLILLRDFRSGGHHFDGIAVDIEWRRDAPDHAERNRRLVELSRRLRQEAPGHPLGAIVYPPVLLEDIKPDFWPGFPWRELAASFDVWLPMAYWTEVSAASGYRDGYRYAEEAARRLRANLQDSSALVHLIGGVADVGTVDDVAAFVRAVRESKVLGWSVYDYRTTSGPEWDALQRAGAS
ncbi:MAG TPA: hypothetical protein VHF24_07780 [Acidimicrobiales bacterium]|nr:hypothetical protein [Acidimicrobiales bacterium]